MKRSNLMIAGYLLVVFASGTAVGGFGYHLYTVRSVSAKVQQPRSPEEYRKRYMNEMQTRLQLSPEQLEKLNVILDETRARFREARERSRPEMKGIQDGQTERIRAILDAKQRVEYEKMHKEREARFKERDGKSSRGHGPGC